MPPRTVSEHFMDPWVRGPADPLLHPGELHVWRANLESAGDQPASLLNHEERARAARITRVEDRRLWCRSRGLLRELLARYLRTEGRGLQLVAGPHGKLALGGVRDPSAELFFNLSHSRHLALFAFTGLGAVGVDVQVARQPARDSVSQLALARRAFGMEAVRRLKHMAPQLREVELLRLWTRYEADLKRRGIGIGAPTQREVGRRDSWLVELAVGPHAAAAVACERPARLLQRWDWT